MCVCVFTCKYIHLYTVHVIVLYNVCGVIDIFLLTVMYCSYSLSSSTLVSLTNFTPPSLLPPNTIIQLVVGVTLHTEIECRFLLVTVSGILHYYKNNN